jgi:type IV pilus assembly protein PilC
VAKRRCSSVLALTLKSGLELEKGIELANELAGNSRIQEYLAKCKDGLDIGKGYDEAMKESGLFNGFQVQMIKVGNRSGRLDSVMEDISRGYEEEADASIDNTISRLEPTIVAVLAVSVGLVLLSVMLPLVGILSAIG